MLGKLLKHEWRSTWKLPTALCIFTVIMTLLGVLSFKMPMWQKIIGENPATMTFMDLIALAVLITYFVSIIIFAYAIMIYFAVRFYKNLYTDEGYLMFTLPTTPQKLILSKTLISAFWNFIAFILMFGSIFLLMYVFMRTMLGTAEWTEVTQAFNEIMPIINDVFKEYAGVSIGFSVVIFVLIMVVGSFSGMMLIYLCISIGQLFRKHKVAAAIIAYLVVTTIVQTVTSIAIMPVTFNMMLDIEMMDMTQLASPFEAVIAPFATMMPLYYVSLAIGIVQSVVSYIICVYISKRKLNLD